MKRFRLSRLTGPVFAVAILGLAIGAVTSLAAILFVDVVVLLNDLLFVSLARRREVENPVFLIVATVLVPTLAGLAVGFLHQFIPERRAHAPADIVRAVQGFEGRIPAGSGLLSALSSVISLGAGASTGQYGPLAHLGATLGSAIAAMVSVVFSNLLARRLFGRSFFDVQLKDRGFDLTLGRDRVILENRFVGEYMNRSFATLPIRLPLAEVKRRLLAAPEQEGYVVDERGRHLGTVTLSRLARLEESSAREGLRAADIANANAPRLHAGTSLWEAMERIADFTGTAVPVHKSADDGRLVGVISVPALARAYADTLEEIRRDEHAAN